MLELFFCFVFGWLLFLLLAGLIESIVDALGWVYDVIGWVVGAIALTFSSGNVPPTPRVQADIVIPADKADAQTAVDPEPKSDTADNAANVRSQTLLLESRRIITNEMHRYCVQRVGQYLNAARMARHRFENEVRASAENTKTCDQIRNALNDPGEISMKSCFRIDPTIPKSMSKLIAHYQSYDCNRFRVMFPDCEHEIRKHESLLRTGPTIPDFCDFMRDNTGICAQFEPATHSNSSFQQKYCEKVRSVSLDRVNNRLTTGPTEDLLGLLRYAKWYD